jgi:RpiB/LacA/LacB family sugar-phosphate isomerase
MLVGIAADHRGFDMKERTVEALLAAGHQVIDFGTHRPIPAHNYAELVVPLARAVTAGVVDRGVAIYGGGVGVCAAANRIPGVRAALIHDNFSARQGVEEENMNLICLNSSVTGYTLAVRLVRTFLATRFSGSGWSGECPEPNDGRSSL